MLLFKYIQSDQQIKENKYQEKEVKPVDAPVMLESVNTTVEWQTLFNNVCLRQMATKQILHRYMRENFYPEQLKPISLEDYPVSYTECCAFLDILDIYYQFLQDYKDKIHKNSLVMTDLIRTMIVIKDKEIKIISECKLLKELMKEKIKKYQKYNIYVMEEERLKK